MKKWLIGIGLVLLISIPCIYVLWIYIFIPRTLTITHVTGVKCTSNGTYRFLTDKNKWEDWWPRPDSVAKSTRQNSFSFEGYSFTPQQPLPHGIDILVAQKNITAPSRIVVIPIQRDSVDLVWQCTYPSSNNPFEHLNRYNEAVALKNSFSGVLKSLKTHLETSENVYGYNIQQTSTTDTLLIAVRTVAEAYPSMQQVYKLITQLHGYIHANDAQETGYPMLNITPTDNNRFQFMVAVPVNKELPPKGNMFPRRMVPGNFMMLEARGGLNTVDHAMQQLQQYAIDHQRTSMAIPFQVLVTDRIKEQDTTKWITRIYYPVM